MKDKKWNIYLDVAIILSSIAFVIISVIAAYFQVKELYPVVGPLVGAMCYWIIRLYQHIKNKIPDKRNA
jgi:hypothetical protein